MTNLLRLIEGEEVSPIFPLYQVLHVCLVYILFQVVSSILAHLATESANSAPRFVGLTLRVECRAHCFLLHVQLRRLHILSFHARGDVWVPSYYSTNSYLPLWRTLRSTEDVICGCAALRIVHP